MVSFNSEEYLGNIHTARLSRDYNPVALNDFHFKDEIEYIEENSVSLTIQKTSKFMSTIAVKAGLSNFEISTDYKIEKYHTIEFNQTYTISKKMKHTITYTVDESKLNDRIFHLAQAAYVYKINCTTREYDDLWWGDIEVDGTRQDFTSYLVLNPYITIGFQDGSII